MYSKKMFRMLSLTTHLSQDIFLHTSFKLIEIGLFGTFTKIVIFFKFPAISAESIATLVC